MTDESNERIHDNDAEDTHGRNSNSTPVRKRGTKSAIRPLEDSDEALEDGDEGRVVTVQRPPNPADALCTTTALGSRFPRFLVLHAGR